MDSWSSLWAERLLPFTNSPSATVGTNVDRSGWLAPSVRGLIDQQLATWPELAAAVSNRAILRIRQLQVRDTTVTIQFNPGRIPSSTARVDPGAIRQRPCFLCPDNLPAAEKGVPFGTRYVVLCNPFPILPDHLVVAARKHVEQGITESIGDLLDLAEGLGPDWFTLYNGPRSGASAPDHLHLQAGPERSLPIFSELDLPSVRRSARIISADSELRVTAINNYRFNLLLLESRHRRRLVAEFMIALTALDGLTGEMGQEPLINLLVTFRDGEWRLVVIPRACHRPHCYSAPGEDRLTVSPAAIDLGGLFVLPVEAHFERITARDVAQICREVTLGDHSFETWVERWRDPAFRNKKGIDHAELFSSL